jgi:hypothetical protein
LVQVIPGLLADKVRVLEQHLGDNDDVGIMQCERRVTDRRRWASDVTVLLGPNHSDFLLLEGVIAGGGAKSVPDLMVLMKLTSFENS